MVLYIWFSVLQIVLQQPVQQLLHCVAAGSAPAATPVQKKATLCCSSGCSSVAASALPAATQCSYCIGWCNTMQQLLHWLLQHSAAATALPAALCYSRYPQGKHIIIQITTEIMSMKFRINQIHMTTRKREKKTKTKTFLLYSYSFLKILRYVELLGITVCVCVCDFKCSCHSYCLVHEKCLMR